MPWYSVGNLRKAWRYVKRDTRDDFVFDVIDHWDIRHNMDQIPADLSTRLREGQYYPTTILSITVPKNHHSFRPGTTIHPIDMMVLYAIIQQLAPQLDPHLQECVYAYRLNLRWQEHLFSIGLPFDELDKTEVPDELRAEFEKHDMALTSHAKVEVERVGSNWTIVDEEEEYFVRSENQTLNVYRWDKTQPLFTDRESSEEEEEELLEEDLERSENTGFPHDWFYNWLAFHEATQEASKTYDYVAITDITAYFENISHRTLFGGMRSILGDAYSDLLDQLCSILRYWDWAESSRKLDETGLPQGNNVSSFLSNLYLRDLDSRMLQVVKGDMSKYFRYVDDIRLYTSNESEAREALVELEKVLRTLGLHTQSAKTEIKTAAEVPDPEVEDWMKRLKNDQPDRVQSAKRFFDELDVLDSQFLSKFQRVYRRSLTVLGQEGDDSAIGVALTLFLNDPSNRILMKNFKYLRQFSTVFAYEDAICKRLTEETFTFDYHRAYLYRLAAHSRSDYEDLRILALEDALDDSQNWYVRVAALLYLSTCRLTGEDLAGVARIREGNTQVARAKYVTLCQYSGESLDGVLERLSYFSAPHQDYLRRYLFRLSHREESGNNVLAAVDRYDISRPLFIRHLHQLDLVKANEYLRPRFRTVIESKIEACQSDWPRLRARLEGIYDSFIENP
jgi:hypothetical protein